MKNLRSFNNTLASALIGVGWLAATETRADSLDLVWQVAPTERSYVTVDHLERGVAINPSNGNVLLLSRAGGPQIYVLNGTDGTDGSAQLGIPRVLSQLDEGGNPIVAGGIYALNLVGVAEDGVVYACNLSISATPLFKVYRWANDGTDTSVSLAYEGDPSSGLGGSGQDIRFGDNFAVRGSGPNTQLVVSARNGKYLALLTTTDGIAFTAKTFTTDTLGKIGLGIAFGDGNTVWAKLNGQPLAHVQWNLATGTATTLRSIPTSIVGIGVTGISYDPATKRLAAVSYTDHTLSVFDLTDPAAPARIGNALPFPVANPNVNGTSAASIRGDRAVGVDTNSGLLAAKVTLSTVAEPPAIDTHPANLTVLVGGTATFSVVAQGTRPLEYQWRLEGADLAGAQAATLTIPNVQATHAGAYTVLVKNAAGQVESNPATLMVNPLVVSDALTPKWKIAPGEKPWLNTDGSQRGLAYNPANGHVLVVSRSAGNQIYVLDGQTGQELHTLNVDPTIVFGGTFALNMVGVADDGAVYACNLTTAGTTTPLAIYRWADDSAAAFPEVAFLGDPGNGTANRWGDSFDVRGAGVDTQIVAGSRNGTAFAVFTTFDGYQFIQTVVDVPDATAGNFGLSVAFGDGNSVWGTATGASLRRASFDPVTGAGATLHVYDTAIPGAVSLIAWDKAHQFLAGITLENPDTVRLYDFADFDNPVLIDQEFCAADNPNVNGTGAADFGGNMLYALNSNNGIAAFSVKRPSATPPNVAGAKVVGANFEFTVTGQAGQTFGVVASTDLKTWTEVAGVTVTGPSGTASIPIAGQPYRFFRAVVK
ncbi:MAG: DUF4623 domain-containing protein [Verrucomicrobia bacterium]|nr:DUF4623 domain-containing protein [Verrucomicrobiota bacterium]